MRTAALVALALILGAALWFYRSMYGPERDNSAFTSAMLLPGNRVVFGFKYVTYKPAQGIAAFPDGGIPKYTHDETMIGVFDVAGNALHVIKRERNTRWTNDQGSFFVSQTSGPMVFVGQGGQTRDLTGLLNENFLLNVDDGKTTPLHIREELDAKGLNSQVVRLVSPQGHIVVEASSNSKARSNGGSQIWLRAPDGSYHLVAETTHYEGVENGEIVYWLLATREFKAFSMTTYATRDLPAYKQRGYVDVTEGVSVSGRDSVQLGRKINGAWNYTTLPIRKEQVIRARVSR